MPSVDSALRALAGVMLIVGAVQAAEPQYGKVETFEPGKKYNCLPTADRKGWDCREAAAKDASATVQAAQSAAPAAAPAPTTPTEPTVAVPQASIESQPSQDATPTTTRPPSAPVQNSGLPSYLRAPSASAPPTSPPATSSEAHERVAAPAESRATKAAPEPEVAAPRSPAPALSVQAAAAPAPAETDRTNAPGNAPPAPPAREVPPVAPVATKEPTSVEKNPAPSPPSREADGPVRATAESAPAPKTAAANEATARMPESAHATARPATPESSAPRDGTSADFLALPGSAYIVELAHAASKSDLDTLRASLHPARGQLYELHLLRDGADWWLLVWGTFDSVDAARAARNELPSDTPLNAGWPRLVAPLQKEARHAVE